MPLKLNAEKGGKAVATKYKVNGFPTILFVDSNGKVVHTIVGYLPPDDFLKQMELAQVANKLPTLEKHVRENPTDGAGLLKLTSIYAAKGREPAMLDSLKQLRTVDSDGSRGLLPEALNAVGDYYQNGGKLTVALPYFQEAERVAKDPHQVAYALISQAGCYLGSGDKKSAIPVLEKLIAMGDAAKEYLPTAQAMLENAKKG